LYNLKCITKRVVFLASDNKTTTGERLKGNEFWFVYFAEPAKPLLTKSAAAIWNISFLLAHIRFLRRNRLVLQIVQQVNGCKLSLGVWNLKFSCNFKPSCYLDRHITLDRNVIILRFAQCMILTNLRYFQRHVTDIAIIAWPLSQ